MTKRGPILTGSGTYRDTVLREMAWRHEIKVYESDADLKMDWDIVHVLDIKHLNPGLLRKVRVPFLIDIHDYQWMRFQSFFSVDLPIRFLLQKYRKYKYTSIIRRSDGVIAHSNYVLSRISHRNKFLVTIGIDTLPFETKGKWSGRNLLMVGRDYFQKGLHTALKALPIILRDFPDARLTVIGKEYSHSKAIARILAIGLPVRFIDGIPREKIIRYYKESSILIHPSEIEAFGIVLIEAMASGLPVVATRVGGIPEVVEDGVNGLLFERGDYRGLAERVIGLLTNPEKASELAETGEKMVKERFSVESMLADIEVAYSTISANRRG